MRAVEAVEALRGHGLLGDCHARPLGPRQVLIVREESLEPLGIAAWQVRANIATRGLAAADLDSGTVLQVGDSTRIRVTHVCEICKVLRGYVPAETFAALARRRGSLGVILDGGAIAPGDEIRRESLRYAVVPETIYERVAWVVERIPAGKVVRYDQLLELVGGSRPYFRVLPTYLRRAAGAGLPAHRVLDSAASVTGHISGQESRLDGEGVAMSAGGVLADERALWDAQRLYTSRVGTEPPQAADR
jgi:alkylated DNA nucleotide flippase Atl1